MTIYNPSVEGIDKPQSPDAIEQPQPKPQMDWGAFVRDLVLKHPKEIKSLVRDLDPDTQAMVFQIIEEKYPRYSGLAKMIIGSGNGRTEIQEEEPEYPEDQHPEDREEPEPDMDADILNEVADYAGKLYLGGFNWTQISDMLYRKYDVDWHPIRVQNIVLKRLAWQNTRGKDKEQPPKEKVIVNPPEKKVGLIRRAFRWLW